MNYKKIYSYLCVVSILAMSLVIHNMYGTYARQNIAQQDLDIMYHTILENHPGPYNEQDPEFVIRMNEAYQQGCDAISEIHSKKDHFQLLKKFAQSFHDEHLTIGVSGDISFLESFGFQKLDCIEQIPDKIKNFSITDFTDEIVLVTIPTFAPDEKELKEFEVLLTQLPNLQTNKYIIFDVRGNGGGSSIFGTKIIESLYGQEYVTQKFVQEYSDCYEDWRASKSNIEYWNAWTIKAEAFFGRDSVEFQEHQNLIVSMQKSYDEQRPLYSMKELQPQPIAVKHKESQNPVHAKIIVIIDSGCFSSCLSFIYELKIIEDFVLLMGEQTATNTSYMEIRDEILPSGIHYRFPTAVGRNSKPFFHFYTPDIAYPEDVKDSHSEQVWLKNFLENLH